MNINFTNNKHFKKTSFGLILVIIVALIGFNINTIKEGLTTVLQVSKTYTNCTQASGTSCKECTGAYIQNSGYNTCYWNKTNNLCGSLNDQGYSKKCDSDPTPNPDPSVCPYMPLGKDVYVKI